MKRKKIVEKKTQIEPYLPQKDEIFYFYKRKKGFLTPVPYIWKPNYQYIKQILDADKRKN